ncbi:TetR family transcriptional regulator [Curtobacterium sp. 24E2]|nr:TetR family transcriptional regulator [Curtobacterium sp. 24E2]
MDEPMRRGGRPRRSSAEVLADAAAELFLEQGYGRTTVDQIAVRAGVSRATFFNYFTAKSDVLWLDLDAAFASLPGLLAESTEPSAVRAVEAALLAAARAHDPERVPWAIAQAEVMGIGPELVASVATRVTAQHATVAAFVASRTGTTRRRSGRRPCPGRCSVPRVRRSGSGWRTASVAGRWSSTSAPRSRRWRRGSTRTDARKVQAARTRIVPVPQGLNGRCQIRSWLRFPATPRWVVNGSKGR